MIQALQILQGDCLEQLRKLAPGSVQCCVTSPPYWGLRDYKVPGMIGLESTFEEWLQKILAVFAEVHRVLRADGILFLNMGDSYVGARSGPQCATGQRRDRATARGNIQNTGASRKITGLKSKDLAGQPWRLAFALQDAGWWLRRDIIWHKPNPMPETVYDRPTTAHEYIFMLTKSAKYFYNFSAAREPATGKSHARGSGQNKKIKMPDGWDTGVGAHGSFHPACREHGRARPRQNASFGAAVKNVVEDRNWRSVWTFPTEKFEGNHFATFPGELARRCIIAGTKLGDVVLDPFGGSGTTGAVALELGRSAILCELNPAYVRLIWQRCEKSRPHWAAPIPQDLPADDMPLFTAAQKPVEAAS